MATSVAPPTQFEPSRWPARRGAVVDAVVVTVAVAVVGAGCGLSAAVFLAGLDAVTAWRVAHPWLPWLLPVAAVLVVALAQRSGPATLGTALVLWRAATGRGDVVPARLWAFALVGTWWTHLFGGSAGREGTALQMGGAWADLVAQGAARLRPIDDAGTASRRRVLLVAGLAGGFGAVFGTPVAGAVFALEVVVGERVATRALVPALLAGLVGDELGQRALHALGAAHGAFPTVTAPPTPALLAAEVVLGVAAGAAAVAFLVLTARVRAALAGLRPAVRGVIGGSVVVALWQLVGDAPLGLSLPALQQALAGEATGWLWASKLVLTAVTVGTGLIGGEVTPLFVVGATLGATVAPVLGLPAPLAAVAALAATFGAAAGTPLALVVMAVELCGGGALVHVAVVVAVARAVVAPGRRSLYERLPPSLVASPGA